MAVRDRIRDADTPRKTPLHALPSEQTAVSEHWRVTPAGSAKRTASITKSRPESRAFSTEAEFKSYRDLIDRALEVFGDELKASRWLSMPSVDLDGKVPLQVAQSVHYAASELQRIFEPVFVRIEHGIYT